MNYTENLIEIVKDHLPSDEIVLVVNQHVIDVLREEEHQGKV